jgi:hypothetical protein
MADRSPPCGEGSILVWEKMRGYHLELNENPGVHHFYLPMDEDVLARLLEHLQ